MTATHSPIQTVDAIIIGAGQAGKPLAIAFAEHGWRTVVIERKYVGGTCINYGCTPTKTMIASGKVAYLARRAAEFGVHTGEVLVNLPEVIARKNQVVEKFRAGTEKGLADNKNIELIYGEATFMDARTVEVRLAVGGTRTLRSERIVIDTGASPEKLDIPGIDDIQPLDSTSVMELAQLPDHLLIIGGGYIALEFGQLFRRLGSEVTIVERGDQLLSREDEDVAQEMEKILREDGIHIHFCTSIERVAKRGDDALELTATVNGKEQSFTASHLLVATGRKPNIGSLNLPAAGVQTDQKGHVQVNEHLETNVPGIYATGDVKGGPAFTHISYDDYRVLSQRLIHKQDISIAHRMVPYTVFTDPQLGRVGLSEQEAREKGIPIKVARMTMDYVARAYEINEMRGMMKVVIDAKTDQILGAAILGVEGGEIMSMLQIAMMGKLPYTAIRDGIFAHPTLAESLNNLFTKVE